jgi:hypothetical protein
MDRISAELPADWGFLLYFSAPPRGYLDGALNDVTIASLQIMSALLYNLKIK